MSRDDVDPIIAHCEQHERASTPGPLRPSSSSASPGRQLQYLHGPSKSDPIKTHTSMTIGLERPLQTVLQVEKFVNKLQTNRGRRSISWPKRQISVLQYELMSEGITPAKMKRLIAEIKMDERLYFDYFHDRVPRDAVTEQRCQLFSIIITVISLVGVLVFAMTRPAWSDLIATDNYKDLCRIDKVVPSHGYGHLDCISLRSVKRTQVNCTVTCTYGIKEGALPLEYPTIDENSFEMSCCNDVDWLFEDIDYCNTPDDDENSSTLEVRVEVQDPQN